MEENHSDPSYPTMICQSAETLLTKPKIVRKLEFSEKPCESNEPANCLREDGMAQFLQDITLSPSNSPLAQSPKKSLVPDNDTTMDSGESDSDNDWEYHCQTTSTPKEVPRGNPSTRENPACRENPERANPHTEYCNQELSQTESIPQSSAY